MFQERYRPSNGCAQQAWKGSAFTIGGGYVWSDVYGEAAKRNVIVVGGGTPVCHVVLVAPYYHVMS